MTPPDLTGVGLGVGVGLGLCPPLEARAPPVGNENRATRKAVTRSVITDQVTRFMGVSSSFVWCIVKTPFHLYITHLLKKINEFLDFIDK